MLSDQVRAGNYAASIKELVKPIATTHGKLDQLVLYFRCRFTDSIEFDTSPFSTHTHWDNRFFRGRTQPVNSGDQTAINIEVGTINMCTARGYKLHVETNRLVERKRAERKRAETA